MAQTLAETLPALRNRKTSDMPLSVTRFWPATCRRISCLGRDKLLIITDARLLDSRTLLLRLPDAAAARETSRVICKPSTRPQREGDGCRSLPARPAGSRAAAPSEQADGGLRAPGHSQQSPAWLHLSPATMQQRLPR
jgi:hypothetical protein